MSYPTGSAATPRVELRTLREQHTATVRETIRRENLTDALGRIYRDVGGALARQRVQPSGPKFARYHTFGETLDLEAGLPVAAPIRPDGDVQPSSLPAGLTARTIHVGSYETLEGTYAALANWQAQNRRTPSGGPWEVYLSDPSSEPDPSRWRTEIFWPL